MLLDLVRDLYAYNRWANRRLTGVTAALTGEELVREVGGSFPSVRRTLIHLLEADWIWLERWKGDSPTSAPREWHLEDHDAIVGQWDVVQAQREVFVGSLDPAAMMRPLSYRSLRGEPFTAPLYELMLHVVNHSTYHRGQITNMLRQLGRAAVGTDLVAYQRERGALLSVPGVQDTGLPRTM
jgi:uncharacterized damage-inducible protein DinB